MQRILYVMVIVLMAPQGYTQTTDDYFNRLNPLVRGYDGGSEMAGEYFKRGTARMADRPIPYPAT